MEFFVDADGVQILDMSFTNLDLAESFFQDNVINLGSDFGIGDELTSGTISSPTGLGASASTLRLVARSLNPRLGQ